ncbi:flavin reductase family protein [Hoeflea sp. WL0058]|uniref:Flavin reductase family protein n=1 Tax=Flavimaribacter sediminis TaxID=2865987 RepID=A0AAE3D1Z7_9HYPH|nr:flavin reductase family protein [Flavimaribacter sediminis]MBW8638452.1 flavin reductase family protein [Flavimaribacter sediminis]
MLGLAMNTTQIDENSVGSQFRMTMRKFPATVTVVTASDDTRDHGMTVTAVTSVSMDPPSLMVCLNNRSRLHSMLLDQPRFAVNVLTASHPEVSDAFSGKVAPEERFTTGNWERDPAGMMILKSAHANVVCTRMAAVPYGTHTIFVGQVDRARVDEGTRPLLYSDACYHVSEPAADRKPSPVGKTEFDLYF